MANVRNILLFVLLGTIWGGAYPVIKIGLSYMPPITFAAIRYYIAGLVMLGYVLHTTEYWYPRTSADWLVASIGGALIIAAYNGFLFIGQLSVKSAVAGILVGMMPVLSALFSKLLLPEESLNAYGAAGIGAGFVGILLIARPSVSNLLTSSVIGQLFVLAAAASMALGSVLSERFNTSQPVETMETWSMILGAVILHAVTFARPSEQLGSVEWTSEAIIVIAYLALLSSAVAYFIYFDLLDRLGPVEMNFIAYAAAGFGAIFSWLLLAERIDLMTIIGFLLIIGGFLLLKHEDIRDEYVQYRGLHSEPK